MTAATSAVSCKSQGVTGISDWSAIHSGGLHSPLLGFGKSLEQLTELRRALDLLLLFIIKDTTQDQPNRGAVWGRVWGNGRSALVPSVGMPPAQQLDVIANTEALQIP